MNRNSKKYQQISAFTFTIISTRTRLHCDRTSSFILNRKGARDDIFRVLFDISSAVVRVRDLMTWQLFTCWMLDWSLDLWNSSASSTCQLCFEWLSELTMISTQFLVWLSNSESHKSGSSAFSTHDPIMYARIHSLCWFERLVACEGNRKPKKLCSSVTEEIFLTFKILSAFSSSRTKIFSNRSTCSI